MELEAKRVVFFSQQDERFFFEWIGRIGCIGNVVGRGDVIYLSLDPDAVLEEDVWDWPHCSGGIGFHWPSCERWRQAGTLERCAMPCASRVPSGRQGA